jgi:hypothetical protein
VNWVLGKFFGAFNEFFSWATQATPSKVAGLLITYCRDGG